MKRIAVIREAASTARDIGALVVGNIGFPSRELHAVDDRPDNFYMLGSMGLASSIGLGIALAQPERRVIALDGDGSVLMNMGSLATIASQQPENYLLVIIDNGSYGSTGDQPTATSQKTDLARVAKGAGIQNVHMIDILTDVRRMMEQVSSGVIVIKVEPGNADVPVIHLCPADIMERFMAQCARPFP